MRYEEYLKNWDYGKFIFENIKDQIWWDGNKRTTFLLADAIAIGKSKKHIDHNYPQSVHFRETLHLFYNDEITLEKASNESNHYLYDVDNPKEFKLLIKYTKKGR
ncbi:MAG: hypothetical protein K4H23_04845 [Mollicutes bacterium PWAP]|nr:hypothetical protein [Mollicutes bacterium PWAP]